MTITSVTFSAANGTEVFGSAPWTKQGSGGSTGLQCNGSNQGKLVVASGADDMAWHGQNIGGADHFVEAVIYANCDLNNLQAGPLSVRALDRNDHVWAAYNAGEGKWGIYDPNGRLTNLTASAPAGETYRLEAEGSDAIRLFKDGSLILSATTTRNNTATYAGLNMDLNGAGGNVNPAISAYRSGLLSDLAGGGPAPALGAIMNYYRQLRRA